jgi:cell wall assembly regulator SMI1
MQPIWHRLEAVFKDRYPTLFASLNPSASVEQLEAFENATGLSLPTDVRNSYLLHDGCTGVGGFNEGDLPLLFCGYRWATLSEMLEWWKDFYDFEPYRDSDDSVYSYTEATDPGSWESCAIRPWGSIFPKCWFPIGQFANDRNGAWFIDMLPGPKGYTGQLITQSYGMSSLVVTNSLTAYLNALADSLESDEIAHLKAESEWSTWMWRYKDSGKGFLSPQDGW